jgi:hypothetical protein
MARFIHALSLATLLASGCAFFTPRFMIVGWSPTEERILDPSAVDIWIRFSSSANRQSAEQAFSLTKEGASVFGTFAWDGELLRFVPAEKLEKNRRYEIAVNGSAEDENGVSLDKEFHMAFSLKAEDLRPSVVSVLPVDGAILSDRFTSIVMTFSEAVDRESLYSAFSLTPSLRGRFDWSTQDSVCAFVPLEPYVQQGEYVVTIRDTLVDLAGNSIARPQRCAYTIGDDKLPPSVLRVSNAVDGIEGSVTASAFTQGWESTWGIALRFSESVERSGLESCICIEPSWSYAIEDSAALGALFILKPQERLRRNILYSITIRKGIKDAQGNPSGGESVYKFKVDGPATASPVATRLRFRKNPEAAIGSEAYDDKRCDHSDDYSAIAIGSSSFPVGTAVETYVDLYFSLAAGASPDVFSLMDAFSIEATNSCATFSIKKMQASSFTGPQPLAFPGETCIRIIADLQNASDSGIVSFKLSEGLVDSKGNPIAGAWRLPLLK